MIRIRTFERIGFTRASGPGAVLLWLAFLAAMLLLAAVALVLIVPAGLVALVYFGARAALAAARRPNGVLDGRANVRVISRPPDDATNDSGG